MWANAAGDGMDNFTATQEYRPGMFSDVRATDWFADSVKSAYELGLMNGYNRRDIPAQRFHHPGRGIMQGKGGGLFDSKSPVKRCEAAAMIVRCAYPELRVKAE